MATGTETATSSTLYFGPWYRKSPFFEATLRYGCKAYDIYNHMYLPGYYDDPITEYWHLLNNVTVWDVAVERIIEISGPDAQKLTNLLTCRDLTKCAVGQEVRADHRRGRGHRERPGPAPGGRGPVLAGPGRQRRRPLRPGRGRVRRPRRRGERAPRVPHADPGASIEGGHGDAVRAESEVMALRYYWCTRAELDGIPVVVSRTGWTGEVGFEIYLLDPDRGDDLWERVMDAGRPYDIRPIAPCEARRIEAGIFNYNSDMTIENNPFELMGMERLVELDQEADFIGKDALRRVAEERARKLVGVEMPGDALSFEIAEAWPAHHDGKHVGRVTDLIWSPRLERNIGYVWVPIELSSPGTTIQVETPSGVVDATTAAIPFLDPTKKIPAA